jgi:hypothetical protein
MLTLIFPLRDVIFPLREVIFALEGIYIPPTRNIVELYSPYRE